MNNTTAVSVTGMSATTFASTAGQRLRAGIRDCVTALEAAVTKSFLEARRYVGIRGGHPYRDDIALARHEGRCSGLR